MSSSSRAENTTYTLEFNNSAFNNDEETFTDLHSCRDTEETDSQCSYSNSLDPIENDENKINKETTVSHMESSNEIINLIREDLYKFVFMPMNKQFKNFTRCLIRRQTYDIYQTFQLEIEYENDGKTFCLLTAEKQLQVAGSTIYTITVLPKFNTVSYTAKLQSDNLMGTSYTLSLVDENEHQRLGMIRYESNFLGLKGPRKIEALLPKCNTQLQELFNKDDIDELCSTENNDYFIHLYSKPPEYNPNTCAYSLSFEGRTRGILASVKNFQMVTRNQNNKEYLIMQFGRVSPNEFFCDFRYPLSLMQAFGIALSGFDSRLFRD